MDLHLFTCLIYLNFYHEVKIEVILIDNLLLQQEITGIYLLLSFGFSFQCGYFIAN